MWTVGNILTSEAAVDYSQPIQYQPQYVGHALINTQMTIENDWRQNSSLVTINPDYDRNSFYLSAYATDNYGTDFEIWITVIHPATGRYLYDSGWNQGTLSGEQIKITSNSYDQLQVVMRIRYSDSTGHYNPPALNQFSSLGWTITYNKIVNYTPIPEEWEGTTTILLPDYPDPVFTTTVYMTEEERSTLFESIKYTFATVFGIADSWESAVQVMNYMNDKLPYVFAISIFCGTVGICVWFMEL